MTKLVLLPGLDGTGIFFGPLLQHLPTWIEPVVISYPASGSNDYPALLELVVREVEHLESFVLLGWSFGGPLALLLSARCPERVSALILCGSFVTPPLPWLVPFRHLLGAPLIACVRALRRTRLLIPGYASSDFRRAKAQTWSQVKAGVLAARARAALGIDARPQLQACNARLMYLLSAQDEVISRTSLAEVQQIAPHVQVMEIAGPHMALFTNPVPAVACITTFLLQPQHSV